MVALPTGSGKTAVMLRIVNRVFRDFPLAKIVIVSHNSEILKQNAKAMKSAHKVCINSAGLGRREVGRLTIAGIQSIHKSSDFADFTHIIIDEAHTIPQSSGSMYRRFFQSVGKHIRIGLTATPYRTGQGYIVGEDHMFDKIVIDLTFGAKFTKLIKDGYISPLIINSTTIQLDTTEIHIQGGDFSLKEMSSAFNRMAITRAALKEMVEKGKDRKKWLVFAIDIDHAENISDELNVMGIKSMVVHSRMEMDKDFIIGQYKSGNLDCIVNVGMLTTGFDQPDIDLIGLIRPTNSPSLHVQMIGRGLRVAPGKEDCLVLDYAGNTERLGPINRIKPYKKGEGGTGEPITKTCEVCDTIVAPNVKICPKCGTEFKFKQLIGAASSSAEIVADSSLKWFKITHINYNVHNKRGSPSSIRVSYTCGLRSFNEWICVNHKGYAGSKAKHWLKTRGLEYTGDIVGTIDKLKVSTPPVKINVKTDMKYPQILGYDFEASPIPV